MTPSAPTHFLHHLPRFNDVSTLQAACELQCPHSNWSCGRSGSRADVLLIDDALDTADVGRLDRQRFKAGLND